MKKGFVLVFGDEEEHVCLRVAKRQKKYLEVKKSCKQQLFIEMKDSKYRLIEERSKRKLCFFKCPIIYVETCL